MRGWGGSARVESGWAGRFLDRLPNAAHESLYGVSLHGSVSEHLTANVAHPSSLPLNIGDAFGIDRSDHVRRADVRRAREPRQRRVGARRARRSLRPDRVRPHDAHPADPARVRFRRPAERPATAARARRAPHQREPRHPRHRHRARRLRHPLRPAATGTPRSWAGSTPRSRRSSRRWPRSGSRTSR